MSSAERGDQGSLVEHGAPGGDRRRVVLRALHSFLYTIRCNVWFCLFLLNYHILTVIAESLFRLWNKEACDFLFFHSVFLQLSLFRGLLQLPLSVLLYITPLLSEVVGKFCLPAQPINYIQLLFVGFFMYYLPLNSGK